MRFLYTRSTARRFVIHRRRFAIREGICTPNATDNHLLDTLPADARHAADGVIERVRIPLRSTIYEPGDRIREIYFPIDAVISVVTVLRDGTQIEVMTVGREGLTGAQSLIDGGTPAQLAWCQVAGDAYRVNLPDFNALCERLPMLRALSERYLSAQLDVMAQAIACNRLHYVKERCARWLLMMHDRVGRDEFPLTHEMLATMLGVRRAGVSVAAAALAGTGAIKYTRGRFTVVHRAALEAEACECYTAIASAFTRRRLPAA